MEMINRTYYNLAELITYILDEELDEKYYVGIVIADALKDLVESAYEVTSTTEPYAKSESNELWCKYIVPTYLEHYVVYNDDDANLSELDCRNWIRLFINKLNETYPKYSKLISLYNAEASKLMDDIKAYSRFNDTPQNGGTFTADSYSTNYTESGSQLASKVARLEEIRTYWANIYKQWSNEFGGLFINE